MRYVLPAYVKIQNRMHSVLDNEEGATMVEYALMVALIAAVAIGVVSTLGTNIKSVFTTVGSSIK